MNTVEILEQLQKRALEEDDFYEQFFCNIE